MKTIIRVLLVIAATAIVLLGFTEKLKSVVEMLSLLTGLLVLAAAAEFALGYVVVTIKAPIGFAPKLGTDGTQMKTPQGVLLWDESKPTKIGVVKIWEKDCNISNLTNIFSTRFFSGNQMFGATRQALVQLTNSSHSHATEEVA